MDGEVYEGDLWYVIPDGSTTETPYTTPFKASIELEKLDVAGRIDAYSASTGRRETVAIRAADGAWSTPEEVNA